jgi:hypothetical protein
MHRLFWLSTLLFVFSQGNCVTSPLKTGSFGYVQNTYGERISLKALDPIKIYFDKSFPKENYGDVSAAVATWERAIGRKVFDLQIVPLSKSKPSQDGKSVIYWIKNWDPKLKTQQANTTIYWDGSRVTEADIRFNATYFKHLDIQSLALHELGHVLGLKHDDSEPSVMAASLNPGFERRNLYPADLDHLQLEY